jgi:hypothetical protein
MGFSTTIYTVQETGQGANTLNGRGGLPALSSISANSQGVSAIMPAVKIQNGTVSQLSAYLTGFYFQQTVYNGSPTYLALQSGIYSYKDGDNIFPYKLYIDQSVTPTAYSTIDWYLSATGQGAASGAQTGVVFWTLSSTALSATSAGVISVAINNPVISFDGVTCQPYISAATTVYCIPSPFPADLQTYSSLAEFQRIQQFLG